MGKEQLTLQPQPTETPRTPEAERLKYSLVIIDFHGTMTDHQLRAIKAFHHSAHDAFNTHLPKEFYQEALTRPSHVKRGDAVVTNQQFIEGKFSDSHTPEQLKAFLDRFKEYMDTTYIPIPGVVQTIRELISIGVSISVLTNGSNRDVIQQTLKKWRLDELSDNLYSSHITGVRKPDTRTIQYILRDNEKRGIEIPHEKILMVGDYIDDTRTAAAFGIDSALMVRGNGWERFRVKEPKPTYIITDPKDLIKIVRGGLHQTIEDTIEIPPTLWRKENWRPKR